MTIRNAEQSISFAELVQSPWTRGILAAIALFGAWTKYLNEADARLGDGKSLIREFGIRDWKFNSINLWPQRFHVTIAWLVLIVALIQGILLADEQLFDRWVTDQLPSSLNSLANEFYIVTVSVFFGAIVLYFVFRTQLIEKIFAYLLGRFRRCRESIGWAVAVWQLRPENSRRVLAKSDTAINALAGQVIDALVNERPNSRLALRPEGLEDKEAANVLYFGHVIEAFCSSVLKKTFSWTTFYEALGNLAKSGNRPFQPRNIDAFDISKNFLAVILQANEYIDEQQEKIPNNTGLELQVREALITLRDKFSSNAVNVGFDGMFSFSYARVLRKSKTFLDSDGMQRQFAKLYALWSVATKLDRPKVFRFPFSASIAIKYLDEGVLRHSGARFLKDDELLQICFGEAHRSVVTTVRTLLLETADHTRSCWREKEKQNAERRKIDWEWWVYYRADQQLYHMSKTNTSTNWTQTGATIETT